MIETIRYAWPFMLAAGRRRLAIVLGIVLAQALMQTLAVFSIVPLLGAAANMQAFRASRLGAVFVSLIGGGSDARVLLWAGSLSLAMLIIGNGLGLVSEYARNRYALTVGHMLRVRLVTLLLDRRYEYFTGTNSSLLVKHLVEDVSNTASMLIAPMLDVFARLLLTIALVLLALAVEPWIVVGGAIIVVLYYFAVMRPIQRRAQSFTDQVMGRVRNLYFQLSQVLNGIKPVIATGRKRGFVARVERASRESADTFAPMPLFAAIPRSGLEILVFGGMIGWLLSAVIASENIDHIVPRIGVVAVIAYRMMPSLQALFSQVGAITASRQALNEVRTLLEEQARYAEAPSRAPAAADEDRLEWNGEIRFEDVAFTYAGADRPAIGGVNVAIKKGQRVAFVGPTGSGKSTLIDLFLGLLRPSEGRITVDGSELAPERLGQWRRTVGYVPQELFLLDATISENIAFGAEPDEIDQARVAAVAGLAQAREFIEDGRFGGFAALVGERGVRISGGQRQRLALARALYAQPDILVLDEATSALDPDTERRVVDALGQTHDQLTVVTVTHRMATVRDYDVIHYVENGRIVASGDFATLAASHPAFAELAR